ncbi:MAG: LysM peptidoglycan-binding domain-containing protein, partial [Alphaproteobacteria bacterium]|nr:LysM peptidoglycan-binding domain-containing protein [Alphaproteobacteria bacterium]
TFTYDASGNVSSVGIVDPRPRTVSFITAPNGDILQRDEADNQSTGDPRELHYYFNGIQVGDVSNNGTSDIDYAASIKEHDKIPGNSPFRDGGASVSWADFDQSYDPIDGLNYAGTASRYTVQQGDTLQSIAKITGRVTRFGKGSVNAAPSAQFGAPPKRLRIVSFR